MVLSKSCSTGARAGFAPPAHFSLCSMLPSSDASFSYRNENSELLKFNRLKHTEEETTSDLNTGDGRVVLAELVELLLHVAEDD